MGGRAWGTRGCVLQKPAFQSAHFAVLGSHAGREGEFRVAHALQSTVKLLDLSTEVVGGGLFLLLVQPEVGLQRQNAGVSNRGHAP